MGIKRASFYFCQGQASQGLQQCVKPVWDGLGLLLVLVQAAKSLPIPVTVFRVGLPVQETADSPSPLSLSYEFLGPFSTAAQVSEGMGQEVAPTRRVDTKNTSK